MIKELSISGFRGFGETQTIKFSIPDGENAGTGLTIITGPNNAGKTTIVESIRAFIGKESPSFSEGKRNQIAGGKINLNLIDETGNKYTISSVPIGGSSTTRNGEAALNSYVVPSRRAIPYEFDKGLWERDNYISYSQGLENLRENQLKNFNSRIFQIQGKKSPFDGLIEKVLGKDFQWTLEQRDGGKYYIKYSDNGVSHSSEGIGDGIWSIFTICAALFDAPEKSVVVIDEPELSVYPALQKRLMSLLIEYSKTHQIIICTHSPYFVNWDAIIGGATLIRVVKDQGNSKCYTISEKTRKNFKGLLYDLNNPHTLGIEANEVFFLEDSIILVEGQEDVVIYNKIAKDLNLSFKGNFYGWGAGGANKIGLFLTLFEELGYKKVVAILDGDKLDDAKKLREEFPNYKIITLKENDVRDKGERKIQAKCGIADEKGRYKPEYEQYIIDLITEINSSL